MKQDKTLFYTPLIIVLAGMLLKYFNYVAYANFVDEDGIAENLTAVFYLIGTVIGVKICIHLSKWGSNYRLLLGCYILFTLFLFFVGMEEISWGQRIFSFQTPEKVEHYNIQNEFNIHNLKYMHGMVSLNASILLGLYGATAWLWFPKKIFGYDRLYFVPDQSICLFFLPIFLSATYFRHIQFLAADYLGQEKFKILDFIDVGDNEFTEFILSIGFLIFVYQVSKYAKVKSLSKTA